jgi:hypothetical protein
VPQFSFFGKYHPFNFIFINQMVMQQTFISAYGKVVIENKILYVRNLKPVLTYQQFTKIAVPVLFIIRFIFYFFEEDTPKRNVGLVLTGFLSFFWGINLLYLAYKALFLQSFSKRIPLLTILSYRIEDDPNELETHLYLKLRSGKERKLTFRTLEKQYEALAEQLSQYLASPKFA